MEITLDKLLASRDRRVEMQQKLRENYPNSTLVCLTVIMPGNIKRNLSSLIVSQAAINALLNRFEGTIVDVITRDLETGYEAYLLTSLSQREAKIIACDIEDNNPLGRLFDIDIFDNDGVPVKRETVGSSPRRCLMCDNEARYCMRNRTHTPQELNTQIQQMVDAYVQQL
ncbi:MAG: citrate lyase holo-[acyl-carrier protein] synthase [Muribaculaceae bacterium]|nr:citrate lyase holo-[acyl-carrier protein] synthase [Muribaculaceae bacterium]